MYQYEIHGPQGVYKIGPIWRHKRQAQEESLYWRIHFSRESGNTLLNLKVVWL